MIMCFVLLVEFVTQLKQNWLGRGPRTRSLRQYRHFFTSPNYGVEWVGRHGYEVRADA